MREVKGKKGREDKNKEKKVYVGGKNRRRREAGEWRRKK